MKFHRQSFEVSLPLAVAMVSASALAIFPMGVGKMINQALNIHVPTFVWFLGCLALTAVIVSITAIALRERTPKEASPSNTPASYTQGGEHAFRPGWSVYAGEQSEISETANQFLNENPAVQIGLKGKDVFENSVPLGGLIL